MYKKIYSLLIFLSLAGLGYAGLVYNPMLSSNFDMIQTIEEEDGSPSVPIATTIKVTNGSLTDNADGTVSLATGAGGGGGDLLADGSIPLTADWNAGNSLYDITAVEFKGALKGNADTVTNATLTTAITVDTGTVGLTGAGANTSVLTLAAGASSIEGTNSGDNTVCTSGAATTAETLKTARAINGVDFNGSQAITVTAAAGTLTGATLKSDVLASSLTSVGTIASLVATTADINAGTFDGVVGGTTPAAGAFTTMVMNTGLAANLKMFADAAGTGTEWANGTKIGTFSIDTATSTGTQVISGVGFKPSHVIFIAAIDVTSQMSIGFDNGTNRYTLYDYNAAGAGQYALATTEAVYLLQGAGTYYTGHITTLGSDGFTVSWAKGGSKTGTATIAYMAFR